MTESYFTCYSDCCFNEDGLREEFSSFFKYKECGGHQLLVKYADLLNEENRATEDEVCAYIDNYENSTFKKLHDEIVYNIGHAYMKDKLK